MPKDVKPPLPDWEETSAGAAAVNAHSRTLIRALEAIGADVLYWGGRRFNKISDRDRAIRERIRRRNPPRRPRRQSHQENRDTA